MRALLSVLCAVLVVAACGRVPGGAINGHFKLYEAVSDRSQIAVIDSQSHAIERWLPLGTPSPDWKHLYSVAGNDLAEIDPETGTANRSLRLPGAYQLPPSTLSGIPGGLSQNGQWLVLHSFDSAPGQEPNASHFVIVNTDLQSTPIRVDLMGHFAFDAISNDGGHLYLIEYIYANVYHVRIYDVWPQKLDPQIVVDKTDPKDSMTGLRLSGIPAHDGGFLYSIYVRQSDGPFIHALTLDGAPIAFCIDLPGRGYQSDVNAFDWSVAMSADGSHLYAANATAGIVSEVNVGPQTVPGLARSAPIEMSKTPVVKLAPDVQAKDFSANAAVISKDGKILITAASSGIAFIDTGSLHLTARALTQVTIWSLALSPDGQFLYALSDSGKIAEISMDSRRGAATFDPGAGNPLALMRVEVA